MDNLYEKDLVTRLQRNDVTAFDLLYNKYSQCVYANIFKLTKNNTVTEDILQEVFTSLWEHRSSMDAGKSVAGWLFVVSYNKTIDFLKRALRESGAREKSAFCFTWEDQEAMVQELQFVMVNEAIEHLSPQKRKVVRLCKMEGKSYEQTAEELNISKHTVKEYLSAAIVYIKKYVQQHPYYRSTFSQIIFLTVPFL